MSDVTTEQLRTLIRFVSPLRELVSRVEHNIVTNMTEGTTHVAANNYTAIYTTVTSILDDPYVVSLGLDVPEGADEEAIASQLVLVGKQLIAYLESFTGVPAQQRRGGTIAINANNTSEDNKEKIFKLVKQALSQNQ